MPGSAATTFSVDPLLSHPLGSFPTLTTAFEKEYILYTYILSLSNRG